MTEVIDHKFRKAYEMARNTELRFPPDIMLHFYAYYKKATQQNGFYTPRKDEDIRHGFKVNALLQVKDLSREEAKNKYIEMVEKHIGDI